MDKMLVNPVQVRNNFLLAQGLLASQDVKCFGLFLCAACFRTNPLVQIKFLVNY